MKVIAINGSPKKEGNTHHAMKIVLDELEKEGIAGEILHIGNKEIRGCLACGTCAKNRDGKCIQTKDPVNEWIAKMNEADGILLGSPVYFSSISGSMKSFLDRAFFVISANNSLLRHKIGASVVAVRRSGGLPTMNSLNHYITYSEMIMPCSNYWNVAHGMNPGEMEQDGEGKQIMEVLGKNMAWLMKVMEVGKQKIPAPERIPKTLTNFIR